MGTDLSDVDAVAEEIEIETSTVSTMARHFDGKAGAVAYLLFILIYAPCVAALAAIYRETNLRWAAFSVLYLTGLAWTTSTIFYQLARFTAHPGSSAMWLGICLMAIALFCIGLKVKSRTMRVAG